LNEVKDQLPELYPFLYQCYRDDSTLLYNETEILSSSGVQQGDPLGPALFSLILQPIILSLCSKLNCWYLDDRILGGLPKNVLADLQTIIRDTAEIGLKLNPSKCEIFIQNSPNQNTILADFDKISPGIKKLHAINMTLLGASLTDFALKPALECKMDTLRRLSDKLEGLLSHHAFHLLRHCLATPRLQYILRCSPTWKKLPLLQTYDSILRSAVGKILNMNLTDDIWTQATSPISLGGIGITSAIELCTPAYLASIHSVK